MARTARVNLPNPLPAFSNGAVPVARGAVSTFIDRLHADYPTSKGHRRALRRLGCEFVYARQVPQRDYWGTLGLGYLVLVRFGSVLEERFGFAAEVPAFYTYHQDLHIRTVDSLGRLLDANPADVAPILPSDRQSIARGVWFLWSPDPRMDERLEAFSAPHRTLVPLVDCEDDDDDAMDQLREVSRRLYSRDLYDERGYVTGPHFYGRAKLTQSLSEGILQQKFHAVFGTRKTGKTSLMKQVGQSLSTAPTRKVAFAYQDLEHICSPFDGFPVSELLPDLVQAVRDALKAAGLRTAEVADASARASLLESRRAIDLLLQRLDPDEFLVLALDEIEYLCPPGAERATSCPGGSEVGQFFGSLRKLTQERSNFAFIVAGLASASVEAGTLFERPNPLFQYLIPHYLGPFTLDECAALLTDIGLRVGLDWTPEGIDAAFQATGGNAFLVRRLGSVVLASQPRDRVARVEIDGAVVSDCLPRWRTEVMPVVREIVSHVERFYPDDFALLELLSEDAGADTSAIADPAQFERLRNLGVIELHPTGVFRPSTILSLDPRTSGGQVARQRGKPPEEMRYPNGALSATDLIANGEGSHVEYKHSLRVPVGRDAPEKVLISEAMQALLGFFNSDGGTLLIGVSDRFEVVGIGPDLKRCKGSRDEFERLLTTKMREYLGPHSHRVKLQYEELSEGLVARLDVPRSDEPVWAHGGFDNAQLGRLHVRQNAMTVALDAKDAAVYMTNHFPRKG
jgi:hypothetical protein